MFGICEECENPHHLAGLVTFYNPVAFPLPLIPPSTAAAEAHLHLREQRQRRFEADAAAPALVQRRALCAELAAGVGQRPPQAVDL